MTDTAGMQLCTPLARQEASTTKLARARCGHIIWRQWWDIRLHSGCWKFEVPVSQFINSYLKLEDVRHLDRNVQSVTVFACIQQPADTWLNPKVHENVIFSSSFEILFLLLIVRLPCRTRSMSRRGLVQYSMNHSLLHARNECHRLTSIQLIRGIE